MAFPPSHDNSLSKFMVKSDSSLPKNLQINNKYGIEAAMRELARPMLAQLSASYSSQVPYNNSNRLARSLSPTAAAAYNESISLPSPVSPTNEMTTVVLISDASASGSSAATSSISGVAPLYRCSSERVTSKLERNSSFFGKNNEITLLPNLSPSQVLTIRRSWKHINTKGLIEVVRKCFQKLETSHSVILSAFVSNDNPQSLVPLQSAMPKLSTVRMQPKTSVVVSPRSSRATNGLVRQKNLSLTPTTIQQQQQQCHNQLSPSTSIGYSTSGSISPSSPINTSPTFTSQISVQSSKEGDLSDTNQPASNSQAPTVRNVTRYFVNLLRRIIDSEEDVELELKRVGARHVALYDYCGVGVPEIEKLGEVFADAFFKLDGIRQSKETTRAWRMLIAKIIDHIRDGFETEMRYQRRKNSQLRTKSSSTNASASTTHCDNEQDNSRKNETNFNFDCSKDGGNDESGNKFTKRNSMPSSRKTSLRVEIAQITRKLSNY